MLFEGDDDIRPLPFDVRRARLEAWHARVAPAAHRSVGADPRSPRFDDLARLRAEARAAAIEGLMLKRGDSTYLPGPRQGPVVEVEARSADASTPC